MTDKEREERTVELIEEFLELHPQLGNVIVDDYMEPTYLIFCDDEFAAEFKDAKPEDIKDKLH